MIKRLLADKINEALTLNKTIVIYGARFKIRKIWMFGHNPVPLQ